MFHSILAPIDGSPDAARALTEAADLAERTNATLTLMTVVSDPSAWLLTGAAYSAAVDFQALTDASEKEHEQLLDQAATSISAPIAVTKVLAHGKPAHKILEQLKQGSHDLIVMGSRGRGEVRSLLLGSVSHEILNAHPDSAVLIVHANHA
jgi:nucleotide-binding universal stress UspA family protein